MTRAAIVWDNMVYVPGESIDDIPESAPEQSIFQDDSTGFQYWFLDGTWRQANFVGHSSDLKPTDCPTNAWYKEKDTGDNYQFDGKGWVFVVSDLTVQEEETGAGREIIDESPVGLVGKVRVETIERRYVSDGEKWVLESETIL